MKFFKRLLCNHRNIKFIRNIFGDEINDKDGKRSEWRCEECGGMIYRNSLLSSGILKKAINDS